MAQDYRELHGRIAGDMSAAATAASLSGGASKKKVRIQATDLPSLVPSNCKVSVEAVPFGKLVMGDIIVVTLGQGPQLRRFVRLKMTKGDTLLITAYEGFGKKEALPKSSLVGRVLEVETDKKTWDPNKINPLKKFWDKLTEFGTHKPFGLG